MNSKDLYAIVKELANKLKISCTCDIQQVGLMDLFHKSKWGIQINTDEINGDLDLKINIQLQEKEVTKSDKLKE